MFTPEQITLQNLLAASKVPQKSAQFAIDLATKKIHSDKQHYWVNKLIQEAQTASVALPVAKQLNVIRLNEMFAAAKQHLKQPKITLRTKVNGVDQAVRLKLATKHDGVLYVDGGSSEQYFGKIDPTGRFFPAREVSEDLAKHISGLLDVFAAQPESVAAAHGKLTGNCCFCQRDLTHENSTSVGYGPICASRYGLQWGISQAG